MSGLSDENGNSTKRKGKPTANLMHQTFGRLRVIGPADPKALPSGVRQARWMCECSCKKVLPVRANALKTGNTTSCGCYQKDIAGSHNKKHGMSGYKGKEASPEYRVWHQMKQRCLNPNTKHYERYGGRGITVCERWMDFATFYEDMGPRPSPKHTLERVDNNSTYSKSNCLWASRKAQSNNTSKTLFVTHSGRWVPLTEAADLAGIPASVVRRRRTSGMPEEFWFAPLDTVLRDEARDTRGWQLRRALYGSNGRNSEPPVGKAAPRDELRVGADLLSAAEREALLWLLEGGAWRGGASRGMAQNLLHLSRRTEPLVEQSVPSSAKAKLAKSYRLTEAGRRVGALLTAPSLAPATEAPAAEEAA